MAECEHLAQCPFFNETLPSMPNMVGYLKSTYCRRDFKQCARYMVRQVLGVEKVPTDLFPYETHRATRIIVAADS